MHMLNLAPVLGLAATISAGTISAPVSRIQPWETAFTVTKRDGTLDLDAINNITGGGYYAEFGIGTPPQKINFQLDTGSSDTWVNLANSRLCGSEASQRKYGYCQPPFDPTQSSSYTVVNKGGFNITYLDGRNILGDYFNDTVTIGGKEVLNQKLGSAIISVRPAGIMGLGYSGNVASRQPYPTIIDNMVSEGLINAAAFSLYLNDLSSKTGTILFGGIDSKKFKGKLAKLPLISQKSSETTAAPKTYSVQMTDFSVKGAKGLDVPTFSAAAILDSGSTTCLLPHTQTQAIWKKLDVRVVRNSLGDVIPIPFINCKEAQSSSAVTFNFGFAGKTITIPIKEMVVNSFPGYTGSQLAGSALSDWEEVCLFGIGDSQMYGIDFALLGDTFLRSAYVVYDMDNQQLGLAQANTGVSASDSNIVEFQRQAKDIPDAEGAPEGSTDTKGDDAKNAAPGQTFPHIVLAASAAGILSIMLLL